ncbi:FAD-binding oxidoreductase [Variovorax sp. dw_308]|uniref:NAD(P)/FAD-dependent oxidoreductase n=1 Tax=Variovorax sp. dw_308 TaxID=2721546 RepID=UPI001C4883DF|nr:FAD-dependent oxidoreductase [Variovorax sp. dw_308]
MNTTYTKPVRSVAVIGGGIVGMLTAWSLLRSGFMVTVLERDLYGLGCSTGNAGSVSAGSVVPLGMPGMWKQVPGWMLDPDGPLHIRGDHAIQVLPWLVRFLVASGADSVERISHALKALTAPSLKIYQEVVDQVGARSLFEVTGQLQVYQSAEGLLKDAAGWALRRARGVEVRDVAAGEIRDLEPAVAHTFTHGVFLPNEGMIINPARLIKEVGVAFVQNGGRIEELSVQGFDVSADQQVRIRASGRLIESDAIVVAAGAWSHTLAAELGDSIPLESQRGYHVMFPESGVSISRPVVASETKCFATPMEFGLRVAGTVEFGSLDAPANSRRVEGLLRHSKSLFPGLETAHYSEWMGNRPCLPDSLPVIGRATKFPSVYFAFGHGHLGMTCAPMTSKIVSDLIGGKEPSVNLEPYRPDRF